ncbi:hypothetical protein SAMN04490357_1056 [Streptomyces misionensis]|uniref:Uncharacterized protein n=1 Tax=Streptomyces misionensis TaxID=67331 RepID=A0A1H4PCN7_9ACTN|nr:hypothetical protein [Streptomyces misionensis]SEC05145.1 hypothetical protein SAMN04490357_1056 [Streptomyces misionensis]
MTLSNAELWAAGLGYVLPPVIAIVNQPRWSSAVKGLLMLVVAVLDGLGTAYFNDQFTGKTIVTCMLTAAIAIGVAYHTVWRPSGIAPGIEQATSTSSPRPAPGA